MSRKDRKQDQIRPLSISTNVNAYAEGSAMISMGNTKVLCTASIESKVPPWLEGKGKGWVTAEYSMLPRATHTRSRRDREKISGRTQEIQRLIARSLRACVNLSALGEVMITVDCDVLQADGGTRTASINGGCVALKCAIDGLIAQGKCSKEAWVQSVSAVSIGRRGGEMLVDLDYEEDSSCDVDMNFVVTSRSEFVEIQGTAEKECFNKGNLTEMIDAALTTCSAILEIQKSRV